MNRSMYMMVSIPACSLATVYEPPVILGVFETKKLAREAWNARPKEYRDIKAKTVHTYVETMICEGETVPEKIWLWAFYDAKQYHDGEFSFCCIPHFLGYLSSYERLEQLRKERNYDPMFQYNLCKENGWKLYAEPHDIIAEFETNKLSRYTVPLTFMQHFDREETP